MTAHPECGPTQTFVCEVCGKVVSRITIKEHMAHHADKPQFSCEDCDKMFYTLNRLSMHKKSHLGDQGKKVMCEHCGRKFVAESLLKNHMFQHTGKRDFICKTCGNSYG